MTQVITSREIAPLHPHRPLAGEPHDPVIEFREAGAEDARLIVDQIVASRDKVRDDDGSAEETVNRWRGYITGTHHPRFAKPPRKIWLALLDGHVVGHIACHLTTKQGFEAELQSIFVRPEHQRRGLGTELLSMAVAWLRSRGARSMMVGFHGDNEYRAFYLKHGGVQAAPSRCEWHDLEDLHTRLANDVG